MFNIFSLIPFILILGFSLTRNLRQKTLLPKEVAYHTLFQSVIAYLFVVIFFFQGFIFNLYVIFIIVPLVVIIGLFYFFNNTNDVFYLDGILRLEAIKNNIVFILITVLPFYVFMTVFRFSNGFIQIFLSVILTLVIFIASILLKEKLERHFSNLGNYLSTSGPMKYVGLWVFILVVIIFSVFFQLPTNKIRQSLNLSNYSGFYVFDGLPTDVQTNYNQNNQTEISINNLTSSELQNVSTPAVLDYYYNEDYLYLYGEDVVKIFSFDTNEFVTTRYLNDSVLDVVDNKDYPETNNLILHKDYLILNSKGAIYLIDETNITNLEVFDNTVSYFYYEDSDDLFLLVQVSLKEYQIYKFISGDIVFVENIDLSLSEYDTLEIFNYTLFYLSIDESGYFLFEDPQVSFLDLSGELIYDLDNRVFYMANDEGYYFNDGTKNTKIIDSFKNKAIKGILTDETLYYLDLEYDYGLRKDLNDSRVIIINAETKKLSLFNHLESQKFLRDKDYYSKNIANYKETETGVEFLQIETSRNSVLFQIFKIEEQPVTFQLPFYSHYDIYIFIWLLVGLLIPITDNIKYITYIDFASVTKNDDE
jgi:hypothetical protein